MSSSSEPSFLASLFGKLLTIIWVLTVSTYAFSLILGLLLILSPGSLFILLPAESLEVPTRIINEIPFFVLFVYVPIPLQISIGNLFTAFWILYACSFVYSIAKPSVVKSLSELWRNWRNATRSWAILMPFLMNVMLAAVVLLHQIQESVGIPTGALRQADPLLLFIGLSVSPLVEEIGFRILPLGFLTLVAVSTSTLGLSRRNWKKIVGLSFLKPGSARRLTGMNESTSTLGSGIGFSGIVGAVTLGLLFGVSHLFGSIGWEIGKVSSATLAGILFGLVFLVYGAHAPILAHWYFNGYFSSYETLLTYSRDSPFETFYGFLGLSTLNLSLLSGRIGLVLLGAYVVYRVGKRLRRTMGTATRS